MASPPTHSTGTSTSFASRTRKDATVAAGTLARFMSTGLVYADGTNMQLIRYDQLPLR